MSLSPQEQGESLVKEGRFEEAVPLLREALASQPEDESLWRFLGAALGSSGDRRGAVEAFTNALSLSPDSPQAHYNLGVAQNLLGDAAGAHRSLMSALSLQPNYPQAREQLAALHAAESGGGQRQRPSSQASSEESPALALGVVLGVLAAILGCVLWWGLVLATRSTGFRALTAIAVGWLIGHAVRLGCKGGGASQGKAAAIVAGVFITLNMIVLFKLSPDVWGGVFSVLGVFWGIQQAYKSASGR